MLKKKLKWLLVPVVAATVFFTASSFTDVNEAPDGTCYVFEMGHAASILGIPTIVCDRTGTIQCTIKVNCSTGKP